MHGRTEETIELTREDLYQQAWNTPMHKLARKYNLSDVGLAKICKKHQIPRPPRGYWAKKKFSKATRQAKLPAIKDEKLKTIHLVKRATQVQHEKVPDRPSVYDKDIALLREQALALHEIKVPERIGRYHPLVQIYRTELQSGHSGPYDERQATLNIDVSNNCRKRAYYFLDTLLKTVEHLGGQVVTQREHYKDVTYVIFANEKAATLRLREKTRRVDHEPKDRWDHTRYDYLSTGLLTLDSWPSWMGSVHVRETQKGKPIEDRINNLIIQFIDSAQRVRNQRRERETSQKRERELQLKRLKLGQQQKEEQARVDELIRHAQNWDQATTIRAFLEAAKAMVLSKYDHIDEGSEFDQWLQWGFQQSDRFDPLQENPPSILDERL